MPMNLAQELVAIAVGLITIVGSLWALWVKKVGPHLREKHARDTAIEHAICGRPAHLDSITGDVLVPELPGIGQRMATVEQALVTLADQGRRLGDLEDEQIDHGERLDKLEAAALERVVARTESTAAFRAMEAAIAADPEETP